MTAHHYADAPFALYHDFPGSKIVWVRADKLVRVVRIPRFFGDENGFAIQFQKSLMPWRKWRDYHCCTSFFDTLEHARTFDVRSER